MASIIDEFKTYLNTPKKIIIFRFCICLVFFLLGLSMVTRVRYFVHLLFEIKLTLLCFLLGRFIHIEYNRSIFRWISLVNYWRY